MVIALFVGIALASPAEVRCRPGAKAPLDLTQLTHAQLSTLAGDLVPMVEEAAGATFHTPPIVGPIDAEGLADVLESETRRVVDNLYDAPPYMLDALARQSRFQVPGILGKYIPATGRVVLGLGPLAAAIDDPSKALDAACLVLAHELTHALQDQVADHGSRFGTVTDIDAFNGLRAVSEGHAVFVEERVAERLGTTDVFWTLARGQGWGPGGLERPQAFKVWALYGQGRAFVRHHHAMGGSPHLWSVLRQPPPRTSMIFRPETYAPAVPSTPSWGEALAGVEQKLTRGDWAVVAGPVGEYDLRDDVAGLDPDEVGDILSHLVHGHQRDLAMPDREAHIRILDFDSPAAPYHWLELLSKGQDALAAALSTPGNAWSVQVVPYDTIEGDAVIRRIVAPQAPHASALETDSVWVVRGTRLVVVQAQRFRPGLRMDWTLEEVFARLAPPPPAQGP